MYWQEDIQNKAYTVPDDVVDLAFSIDCRTLPVDHAYPLAMAVRRALPWFGDEPSDGLHLIHVADSGNGWERPSGAADLLYLSRRTPLVLRLARDRVENARALTGQTLDIAGNAMVVGEARVVHLSPAATLYSRYIAAPEGQDEEQFVAEAVQEMRAMGLRFKKVLAGIPHHFETPEGPIFVRSLMVADLPPEDAVTLQQRGLGPHRALGCGLFIAHKSINKVNSE
ncbi:MAG: type I-MYXAN CRISPR-associated protein Cas6/Cmx6 [Gammaproteobacteria bacterium HGW-Gammaproteobacteria-1]|jgi:CRISPR-associated protein Cas6|nr:MAG: type I-MYXAN CRISPR-associated protein Cas6/Cmx6 [Gammaproteobacteria bacterium HGW-Gammaproteobacteria-1]